MPEPFAPALQALAHPLQHLTERLAAAQTRVDVIRATLSPIADALGAVSGAVLLLDPASGELSVAATQGDQTRSVWQGGPVIGGTPIGDALAGQRILYFEHPGELAAAYPELEARTGGLAAVASAVVPMFDGHPLGVLALNFREPHTFTAEERRFLEVAAGQIALALQRAELLGRLRQTVEGVEELRAEGTRLERRVAQGTADLRAEQLASRVFVNFTEAASRTDDIDELGRLAMETLQAVIPGSSGVLYDHTGDAWTPRHWTNDIAAPLLAELRRGLPLDFPLFAEATETQAPTFLEGWNGPEQGVLHAEAYQTTAVYPVVQGGVVCAVLTLALQEAPGWTAAQQAIFRAVGRSFTLLYARISAAAELRLQKEEATLRSQALEAFALVSRDLADETDRYVLVRRAQEIILALLTPGYALYWEQAEDRHWQLRAQVGDIGNPELQRLVDDHGLPFETPALHSTWRTGVPNYQDDYAQGADTPADMIRHVNASTAFQVRMHGRAVGMLAIGLFDQRTWTPLDKAALETAIYSLGLLLERAQSIRQLAERTSELEQSNQELAASNAELEAFTYSASHDLRTPVRHVRAFAELSEQALAQGTEPQKLQQASKYLQVIKDAATRMNTMIDAMLTLSRTGRADLSPQAVSLGPLVEQARQDALLEFPGQPVEWRVDALPTVQGDPDTLQQALTNLLSNAVKYGKGRDPLRVRVWAEERATEWAVFVQDSGAGFDPVYAHKLFGAFQRLHNQRDFAGTGIGLATVKRIVTRHGGRVWAEGTPGEGATFGFSLPRPS